MASIDYQEARKEITKMFSQADGDRRIIFWYDAPANFKEDILADTFDNCRLLVCEKNEFALKKIIEHDDPDSNILVYVPSEKPKDTENWLLDILMYSDEYYADTVALTMRRLGLTNTDLRRIIEKYAKFFDSEARIKKLGAFVEINDAMYPADLLTGMMSVIVKAPYRSIDSVLTELVFDDTAHSKYAELRKFGFEDYLWDEICRFYNYDGDQKVETLIKRFMFTALLGQKAEFDSLPSFYDQYTITGAGKIDAGSFVDKLKSDSRYESLQLSIATDLKIEGLLVSRDIACVQNADVFECFDEHIIKIITESLQSGSLDYENFEKVIYNRCNSMWYQKHEAEYGLLSAAMSFFKMLESPIPSKLLSTEYIRNYVDSYYKIDTSYRLVCTYFKQIDNGLLEFEQLMDRVEMSYQSKFLDEIGPEYSRSLAEQNYWHFAGLYSTNDFYKNIQRNGYKKLFVIISDGLRYEIGHELYERFKVDQALKGTVDIDFAISPLPSETRFGMASLLPHQTSQYSETKGVQVDNQPTNSTTARDAVLKAKNASYAAIGYDEISNMARNDLRAYMADKSLVYIYHNVIDNTGEHNEGRVFDEVDTAISEIVALVKKLYNSLQISNFYITADHGFLYRRNTIEESQKYSNVVAMKPVEAAKRYVISDEENFSIPYTNQFVMDGVSEGQYKVSVPFGYDLFKTQGSGLQYVHGGASLQETIVPIVHIGELNSSKAKGTLTPVGVRLKSIVRKITNRSFTLEFEQYEKVEDFKQAINCETFIEDEKGNLVSGVYKFIANSSSDDPETRVNRIRFNLTNTEYDRNTRYYLILRNAEKPDEYIAREQFTIDILSFKMF